MPRSHALFYHGPFEINFDSQRPGKTKYIKRDGTTAPYRGPSDVSGLRFGQMEKAGTRAMVITRIQGPDSDVCLQKPTPGRAIGPSGAWLTPSRAAHYLERAIRANRRKREELEALRTFLSEEPTTLRSDIDTEAETLQLIEEAPDASTLTETDRIALVQARRGQGRFRDSLCRIWGACAVTSCSDLRVLRASHLKPWKVSTNAERLDPYNGLLLTPNLDAALDRGLISFTDDGAILLSPTLRTIDRRALGLRTQMKVHKLDLKHHVFLRYHRAKVWQRKRGTVAAV